MLGTRHGGLNVSGSDEVWRDCYLFFTKACFSNTSKFLFSLTIEKENLEKIDDDEDSQAYHLEDEDGDDHDADYVSGGELNDSALNESAESHPEGELT